MSINARKFRPTGKNEVLFLDLAILLFFFKMSDRIERIMDIMDGDYRSLLSRLTTFEIAGLLDTLDLPVFTRQAYEEVSQRSHRKVLSDTPRYGANDFVYP